MSAARETSEWPKPCDSEFEAMAEQDPSRLRRWLDSGTLGNAHTSFALVYLGKYDQDAVTFIGLRLGHHSSLVREGAVLGLDAIRDRITERLEDVALTDVSPGVRAAARDCLS